MQTHPGAVGLGNLAQGLHQFQHAGLDGLAVPEAGAVLHVHAIGRCVLADDQQLLHAAFKQGLGFLEHIAHRARNEVAAHGRDDAEGAAVVTAFADLQVRIVARRELDARLAKSAGHQIEERVVRLGQVGVYRLHHLLRGVWAGDGEHTGVHVFDQIASAFAGACTQAARDDDLAVFGQGFANGVQAFLHGIVNEPAGVDDDEVGALEGLGGFVALGAELREDEFGVRQRLGAAQADESDFGCFCGGECFAHPPIVPVPRGGRLLAPHAGPESTGCRCKKSCDQRLSPNAPSICSVCFCICSCICVSMDWDCST